jgi:hypothetical protein
MPLGLHLLLSGVELVVGHCQLFLARHAGSSFVALIHRMVRSRRLGGQFVSSSGEEIPGGL